MSAPSLLPVDELLTPLADGNPSGPDLAYDPDFTALERAALGKPEQQIGDFVRPAEPPLWPDVLTSSIDLLRRTRDLRLAVLLARAAARTSGIVGYVDALRLIAGLLEDQWGTVHPVLDASEGDNPIDRLNALAPLGHMDAGLADLRAAVIGRPASGLTVRTLELAWSRAEPFAGEARPTAAGALQGLRDAAATHPAVPAALAGIGVALDRIAAALETHGAAAGSELKPLRAIVVACGAAAAALDPAAVAEPAPALDSGTTPAATVTSPGFSAPGALHSRDDVLRLLDTACDWIERHEPSNPAPLLIRRAQRLMSKSFIDLVRDLAPDGLGQLERIAGVESS